MARASGLTVVLLRQVEFGSEGLVGPVDEGGAPGAPVSEDAFDSARAEIVEPDAALDGEGDRRRRPEMQEVRLVLDGGFLHFDVVEESLDLFHAFQVRLFTGLSFGEIALECVLSDFESLDALAQVVRRRFPDFGDLVLEFFEFRLGSSDLLSDLLRFVGIGCHHYDLD